MLRDKNAKDVNLYIQQALQDKNAWKYVKSLTVLKKYKGINLEIKYNQKEKNSFLSHVFKAYKIVRYSGGRGQGYPRKLWEKVKIIAVLYSNEQLAKTGCSLTCGHGKCEVLQYSSSEYCHCTGLYSGTNCNDHIKTNFAKALSKMFVATSKLPVLSDVFYEVKDLQVFMAAGLGKIQATLTTIQSNIRNAFQRLEEKLTNELKWVKLNINYGKIIRDINYYAKRLKEVTGVNQMGIQRRQLAEYILKPEGRLVIFSYNLRKFFLLHSQLRLLACHA